MKNIGNSITLDTLINSLEYNNIGNGAKTLLNVVHHYVEAKFITETFGDDKVPTNLYLLETSLQAVKWQVETTMLKWAAFVTYNGLYAMHEILERGIEATFPDLDRNINNAIKMKPTGRGQYELTVNGMSIRWQVNVNKDGKDVLKITIN